MASDKMPKVSKTDSSTAIFLVGWPERFHMAERYADEVLLRDPELTDSDKLLLASLRSQANSGPCTAARPSIWNKQAMAQWSSWRQLKSMSKPEAMNLYVRAVGELHADWWSWPELGLVEAEEAVEEGGAPEAAEAGAEAEGAGAEPGAGEGSARAAGGAQPAAGAEGAAAAQGGRERVAPGGEGGAGAGPRAAESARPAVHAGLPSGTCGWQPLQTTGLAPRAHYRHAAAVIGAHMYVFGGRTHGGRLPEGLRVLSLLNNEWTEPAAEGVMAARYAHTMSAWRHILVVFGGMRRRAYLGDVALLDTHNMCWLNGADAAARADGPPAPRAYHSASLIRNQLFVFGGEDSAGLLPPTVHALDLLTLSWAEHACSGTAPPPVRDHVSAATGSRMLVVGGCTAAGYVDGSRVHVLETESLVWAQLRCGGQVPSARAGHAAAMTPSHGAHGGSDLCIFGGGDGRRGFADLFRLDLASAAWSKVALADGASSALTPREGASCVAAGPLLVVFGGYTSTGCSSHSFVSDQGLPGGHLLGGALLGGAPEPAKPAAAAGGARARGGAAGGEPEGAEGPEASPLALLGSDDPQELSAAQEVFGRALQAAVMGVGCSLGGAGGGYADGGEPGGAEGAGVLPSGEHAEWMPVGHDETYGAALQQLELLQLKLALAPESSPARRAAYLCACHAGLLPVAAAGEEHWHLFYWVCVQAADRPGEAAGARRGRAGGRRRAAAMSAGVQLSPELVARVRSSRFMRSIGSIAREMGLEDAAPSRAGSGAWGDEVSGGEARGGGEKLDVQEWMTHRLMTMHAQLTEAWYSAIGALLAAEANDAREPR